MSAIGKRDVRAQRQLIWRVAYIICTVKLIASVDSSCLLTGNRINNCVNIRIKRSSLSASFGIFVFAEQLLVLHTPTASTSCRSHFLFTARGCKWKLPKNQLILLLINFAIFWESFGLTACYIQTYIYRYVQTYIHMYECIFNHNL